MLDPMMQRFQDEMRPRAMRPSGTRRGGEVDVCSGLGAACLARQIQAFWLKAGFSVVTEVVMVASGKPPVYGVRSNLAAGLPKAPGK
jgi:hypothetical protein